MRNRLSSNRICCSTMSFSACSGNNLSSVISVGLELCLQYSGQLSATASTPAIVVSTVQRTTLKTTSQAPTPVPNPTTSNPPVISSTSLGSTSKTSFQAQETGSSSTSTSSSTTSTTTSHSGLSSGAKAGIGIGVARSFLLLAGAIGFGFWWGKRSANRNSYENALASGDKAELGPGEPVQRAAKLESTKLEDHKAELGPNSNATPVESSSRIDELEGGGVEG